jgi:NADPH2:quinone reductase
MKAVFVEQTGGVENLKYGDLPKPEPGPGQALVKIAVSGVNFIDVYFRKGVYPAPPPIILGSEGAGTVESVGPGVQNVAPGDRVAYAMARGSYAEYAVAPAWQLVKIPPAMDFQAAAAAMLQGMTAHYLCYSTYPLKKGETALVHAAAGGVGLLLVQMAHNIGARVIATVSTEEKAKLARAAGADELILYAQTDFETETKRLTAGHGVDVVYDSVGETTFEKGLNVLRPRGYMVLYGGSSGAVPPFDLIQLSGKGSLFVTRPSLGHYLLTREELETRTNAVFSMIAAGTLRLRVEHTYPLKDAAQAHRDLEGRKTTGKLLLLN